MASDNVDPLDRHPDPDVAELIASASKWIGRALTGWVDEDAETVGLLAPIAVEHLGKATLWARNPALLVPLGNNAESALLALTTAPSLTNPQLRTVGLGGLLDRRQRVMDGFPLSNGDKKNLIDTRNGSVHVGAKSQSQHIIRDALRMCTSLLDVLVVSPESFFGEHFDNVVGILDEQRSKTERRVLLKTARAKRRAERLGEGLSADVLAGVKTHLESVAREGGGLVVTDTTIDYLCPACTAQGRLDGFLDVESQVDWDVEKIGDTYEPYPVGSWELRFSPMGFRCNVCGLSLDNLDELLASQVPAHPYSIDSGELDEDFDLEEYASRYSDEL